MLYTRTHTRTAQGSKQAKNIHVPGIDIEYYVTAYSLFYLDGIIVMPYVRVVDRCMYVLRRAEVTTSTVPGYKNCHKK